MPSCLPVPPQSSHTASLKLIAGVLAASVLVGGCSSWFDRFTPNFSWTYRSDIWQGTVVTQEMAAQLKPGQTREQVRFVLGTPSIADLFHTNQWDYQYRYQPGRGPVEQRDFTVYFEADKLVRFEGDPLPTEKEFVASRLLMIAKREGRRAPPTPTTDNPSTTPTGNDKSQDSQPTEAPPPPSLWQRLKSWLHVGSDSGAS
jgi:outer membrane protein assembly factor BamE